MITKRFLNSHDVADLIGVSYSTAHRLVLEIASSNAEAVYNVGRRVHVDIAYLMTHHASSIPRSSDTQTALNADLLQRVDQLEEKVDLLSSLLVPGDDEDEDDYA